MGKFVWFRTFYRDATYHALTATINTRTLVPVISVFAGTGDWLYRGSVSYAPTSPQFTVETEDMSLTFEGNDVIMANDGYYYILNCRFIASRQEHIVAQQYSTDGVNLLKDFSNGQSEYPPAKQGAMIIVNTKAKTATIIDNAVIPFSIVRAKVLSPQAGSAEWREGWSRSFNGNWGAITKGELRGIGDAYKSKAKRRTWPKRTIAHRVD